MDSLKTLQPFARYEAGQYSVTSPANNASRNDVDNNPLFPARAVVEGIADNGCYILQVVNGGRVELASNTALSIGQMVYLKKIEQSIDAISPKDTAQYGEASLSLLSKILGSITARAINTGYKSDISVETPLIPSEPIKVTVPDVARAIQKSISESGLFYESHLKNWDNGLVSREEILKESAQIRLLHNSKELVDRNAGPADINPRLVSAQLNILESQALSWTGFSAQQQPLSLCIQKESSDASDTGQNTAPQTWNTELRLSLPVLGDISAAIRITQGVVHVRLEASSPDSMLALKSSLPLLCASLHNRATSNVYVSVDKLHE